MMNSTNRRNFVVGQYTQQSSCGDIVGEQYFRLHDGPRPASAAERMTIEWAMAGIMDRPGLDLLTRELILAASRVTLGHAMPQLRAHAEAAIKLGATGEQIVETVLRLTFYAGGPAVRNSLVMLKDVFVQAGI
jgi:alkylhydroperoxidase/carboxymuconolactone decarboxylase family protein YurZ